MWLLPSYLALLLEEADERRTWERMPSVRSRQALLFWRRRNLVEVAVVAVVIEAHDTALGCMLPGGFRHVLTVVKSFC